MRKSRLSEYKQNRLIELFIAGSTSRTASKLVSVNKTTASYYFHRLRLLIYENSEHLEMFTGEVEADESYFGGRRKGKRGRGAGGKVPVFGLLKRNGKVYSAIIPDAKSETLIPIIREKVKADSDLPLQFGTLNTYIKDIKLCRKYLPKNLKMKQLNYA